MKITKLLLILIIISLINCMLECNFSLRGIETNDCGGDPVMFPIIDVLPMVKLKAPSDRGTLDIKIQNNDTITLLPEETSSKYIFITYSNNLYSITSSTEGILLNDPNFNFQENLKDGIILRTNFNIFKVAANCYLLDGMSGEYSKQDCNLILLENRFNMYILEIIEPSANYRL